MYDFISTEASNWKNINDWPWTVIANIDIIAQVRKGAIT